MRIGIVSEGHADRAVITNILIGLVGVDSSDIEALRPIDKYDETDKAVTDSLSFGGWSAVKEECESRKLIDEFLSIEGQDFVVIHLDTAEVEEYGITRPDKKQPDYCGNLRDAVVQKIDEWLTGGSKNDISDQILHAVSIEEIEAWILTIYDPADSSKSANPKDKLKYVLGRKGKSSISNHDNFLLISKPLSKGKEIRQGNFLSYNCSLKAFFNEVKTKVPLN